MTRKGKIAARIAGAVALVALGYGGLLAYNAWWWDRYGGLAICARLHALALERPASTKADCGQGIAFGDQDMFIHLVEKYRVEERDLP